MSPPTGRPAMGETPPGEETVGRLLEAIALLDAIERGELLDALPSDPEAAERHQCGVSLLAVLRRELAALACELQSAGLVQDVIARVRSARRGD